MLTRGVEFFPTIKQLFGVLDNSGKVLRNPGPSNTILVFVYILNHHNYTQVGD